MKGRVQQCVHRTLCQQGPAVAPQRFCLPQMGDVEERDRKTTTGPESGSQGSSMSCVAEVGCVGGVGSPLEDRRSLNGSMPRNHEEVWSCSSDLGAAFLLMLGCPVLSIPNPGCFSSPQLDSVSSFVLSTPQLCMFRGEQPCVAWLVTCHGCILSSWSGKKAGGSKQLSAFWPLSGCCSTCVGQSHCLLPAGWSQGSVKYVVWWMSWNLSSLDVFAVDVVPFTFFGGIIAQPSSAEFIPVLSIYTQAASPSLCA